MAITVDFGNCEKCNEKNSKAGKVCRKCGAPLPWSGLGAAAKRAPSQAVAASGGPMQSSPQLITSSGGSGGLATSFVVQCVGGLIFLAGVGWLAGRFMGMFPYVPLLTYGLMAGGAAIWRVGSTMDDYGE